MHQQQGSVPQAFGEHFVLFDPMPTGDSLTAYGSNLRGTRSLASIIKRISRAQAWNCFAPFEVGQLNTTPRRASPAAAGSLTVGGTSVSTLSQMNSAFPGTPAALDLAAQAGEANWREAFRGCRTTRGWAAGDVTSMTAAFAKAGRQAARLLLRRGRSSQAASPRQRCCGGLSRQQRSLAADG